MAQRTTAKSRSPRSRPSLKTAASAVTMAPAAGIAALMASSVEPFR